MSLIDQYESSKYLQGYTLGFYKFFEAFKLLDSSPEKRHYNQTEISYYTYKWNDIMLSSGNVLTSQHDYTIPPCSCIKDTLPIGGYFDPCTTCKYCGHTPVLAPPRKTFQDTYRLNNTNFIDDLNEFSKEQIKWIQCANTQKLYKSNKRQLREECQRRINFFVQALHKYFAGTHNTHTNRGTCDLYLRDIRNLAHLCLKE